MQNKVLIVCIFYITTCLAAADPLNQPAVRLSNLRNCGVCILIENDVLYHLHINLLKKPCVILFFPYFLPVYL